LYFDGLFDDKIWFKREVQLEMKTITHILVMVLIVSSFILVGCATKTTTSTAPAATTNTAAAPSTSAASSTSTAASSAAPASAQQYGGTLVIVCDESIDAMGFPAEAQPKGFLFYKYALPIMETLVNVDTKENIIPGLADSWDIAPDGKTITLHLHKGIKFHDGTDFNAAAVKENLQAWDLKNAPYLANITSIDIPDDFTVIFNLKLFDSLLLNRLATGAVGMIASPTAMKKATTPEMIAQDHMVGTGPYTFVDWKRQNYVKYKKNPNYWQTGKPYLDAIEFRFVPDYMTRQMSFKAGEAQYTGALYPVDANNLAKEGYRIEPSELTFVWRFFPDGGNPESPFSKLAVREAVEYAIDRDTIAKGIGEGVMSASYQFAQPKATYFTGNYPNRVYNVAKAKQLLESAGFPGGFKSKIITDVRVKMDLVTAVQKYLKDAGIDCEVEVADVPRMSDLMRSGWKNAILWEGYPIGSTQSALNSQFGTANTMVSMYRPDGWQASWEAMIANPDEASRLAQWTQKMKDEADSVMAIPLVYDHRLYAAQPKLHALGWSDGLNALWWDPANAWISK
jgi:peptide/nickel transport system substrate-binding protein